MAKRCLRERDAFYLNFTDCEHIFGDTINIIIISLFLLFCRNVRTLRQRWSWNTVTPDLQFLSIEKQQKKKQTKKNMGNPFREQVNHSYSCVIDGQFGEVVFKPSRMVQTSCLRDKNVLRRKDRDSSIPGLISQFFTITNLRRANSILILMRSCTEYCKIYFYYIFFLVLLFISLYTQNCA